MAVLGASDGGTSSAEFERLAEFPWAEIKGADVACLAPVFAQGLQADIEKSPLKDKGKTVADFHVFVTRGQGKCIVEIAPKGRGTGGGVQYWVDGNRVVKKGLTK